jgi:hypothetical protein
MSEARIREIIEAFDQANGNYKRAELEEAIILREAITPLLIRILEEVAADPAAYADEGHFANVYAVALLAHFQEPAAHLPIIRAFCIDDEQREDIWGDMVTETLPALLFQTCNGFLDTIKELILNKKAHDYVRGSAVEALTYAVARGVAKREEVIGFLSGLFSGTEANADSDLWCVITCAIADIHPAGAMDVIRTAYKDGLVYDGFVGLRDVEEDLLKGQDEVFESLLQKVGRRIPEDVDGYVSWFACFRENAYKAPRPIPVNTALIAQQNRKKSNRARSKAAKKSRKKNRR